MAYDFKREQRDLYQPKKKPSLVDVPAMTFAAVAGEGDPNEENGAYARATELLYTFSYTVKMSKKGTWQPAGYFDYVVPPLEGLWWRAQGPSTGRRSPTRARCDGSRSSASPTS
nr:GyrI-like domain-containing protein [Bifidobacterium pullorum]